MRKVFFTVLSGFFLISCAAMPNPSMAQDGTGIRVMVMVDDSDELSVKHTSDIFSRAFIELQSQMTRYGFFIVDEEMLAANLGWSIPPDRRPKMDLVRRLTIANESSDPRNHVRAMVVLKLRAGRKTFSGYAKAEARITGDIYDIEARRFLGAWEAPRHTFPVPEPCNRFCIQEVVGDHARDLGASLGDVLRKKLAYLTRGGGSVAGTTGAIGGDLAGKGLVNEYAVTFRNFSTREILEFTEIMEKEFPGYVRSDRPTGDSAVMTYAYRTRAPSHKLYKWVNILLMDMGLDPDSNINVTMRGTAIMLDKIVGGSSGPLQTCSGRFC